MDNEEVVRKIEIELKIGKLDSLLLFISSSLGLGFTLVQSVLGGIASLVYFSPLLLLI
jgi:hypothetical protein